MERFLPSLNKSSKLLILLLFLDLAFILLHCVAALGPFSNPLFFITQDQGYAEIYQYLKEFAITAALLLMAAKQKQLIYAVWSLLFLYLLLDDSLQAHEQLGQQLADYFRFRPVCHLRTKDLGQLCVSILFGASFFLMIGTAYLFSDSKARQISSHLFVLVILLGFFGVFTDLLHAVIPWKKTLGGLIEDGGEMFTMSIIVWYVSNPTFTPANLRSATPA